MMNKENKRILRKLGYPVLEVNLTEEQIIELREESVEIIEEIHIELLKEHDFTLDISEVAKKMWIEKYTLALSKELVGIGVRGKFNTDSEKKIYPMIDKEALLEEGQQEKRDLMDALMELGKNNKK